jgi:hypothetical protein
MQAGQITEKHPTGRRAQEHKLIKAQYCHGPFKNVQAPFRPLGYQVPAAGNDPEEFASAGIINSGLLTSASTCRALRPANAFSV